MPPKFFMNFNQFSPLRFQFENQKWFFERDSNLANVDLYIKKFGSLDIFRDKSIKSVNSQSVEDFLEGFSAKSDPMKYKNQKIAIAVLQSFNSAFQKDSTDKYEIEFENGEKYVLHRPV